MPDTHRTVTVRHWLPIMTFCPVNHLPDLVYASVTFVGDEDQELYGVRKRIRKTISGRKCFMERLAEDLLNEFPTAFSARINLAFARHTVYISRN